MSNWKQGDPDRRTQAPAVVAAEDVIAEAASEAAKVIAKAAELAISTLANAATTAQNVVNIDLNYIKKDMTEIKLMLESKYVTKEAFSPVKMIAYGMVGAILLAVIGALLSLIIAKV